MDALDIAEPIILKLTAKLLRGFNDHDQEDAAQVCRVHVWQQAGRFNSGRGELRGYLFTLIRNKVLDYRDRLKAQRRHRPVEEDDARAPEGGADELIEQLTTDPASLLTTVDTALLNLLNTSRNRDQLAAKLGTTKHATDMRIHRLKRVIRELAA